jgi:hypothetical protein
MNKVKIRLLKLGYVPDLDFSVGLISIVLSSFIAKFLNI